MLKMLFDEDVCSIGYVAVTDAIARHAIVSTFQERSSCRFMQSCNGLSNGSLIEHFCIHVQCMCNDESQHHLGLSWHSQSNEKNWN